MGKWSLNKYLKKRRSAGVGGGVIGRGRRSKGMFDLK